VMRHRMEWGLLITIMVVLVGLLFMGWWYG
jgi:hypothetical protein